MKRSILDVVSDTTSRMSYDKLDTPIKSYVDNLRAQMRDIAHKYGKENLLELTELMKDPDIMTQEDIKRLNTLKEHYVFAFEKNTVSPHDREYIQDKSFLEALSFQDAFYRSHNLSTLADMLPTPEMLTQIPKESLERIAEARKEGFDCMLIVPSTEQLALHRDSFIQQMLTEPSDRLTGNEQYTPPKFFDTNSRNPTTINRPVNRPYILLYQSTPVSKTTKDLTFPKAREYFKTKNWNGLTLDEYFILQRMQAEQNQNHSFDSYNDTQSKSNWTWLLDSSVPSGVVHAYWLPANHQVYVGWAEFSDSAPMLGARSAIVVEL